MSLDVGPEQRGWFHFKLTGVASTGNAGQGQLANPENAELVITRCLIDFHTGSTGAANLDMGIGASGAKASELISAMDMIEGTVGGKVLNAMAFGSAETALPVNTWAADEFLTATASGSAVGLDADVYVEYLRLGAAAA
jgi:hypothetical protein